MSLNCTNNRKKTVGGSRVVEGQSRGPGHLPPPGPLHYYQNQFKYLLQEHLSAYEDLSYRERLCNSGLKNLELTRLHADLVLCYKILHGLIAVDTRHMFDFDSYYEPRSHGLALRAPKVRTELGLNSFNYRTSSAWNKLSPNTVWSPTLKIVKTNLLLEDLSDSLTLNFDTFQSESFCYLLPIV